MSKGLGIFGPRHHAAVVVPENDDPLDPTDGGELYNRIKTNVSEAYPNVNTTTGYQDVDGTVPGVDTFYGMDTAQPSQTMPEVVASDDTEIPFNLVERGLDQRKSDLAHEQGPHVVRVNPNAGGMWRGSSFQLDSQTGDTLLADNHERRGDVVVTNWSASDLYVSHTRIPGGPVAATPSPSNVKVAANGGVRVLHTQGQVWGKLAAAAGITGQVDVQEEYN